MKRALLKGGMVLLFVCGLVSTSRFVCAQGQTFDPLEAFNANGFDQNRDYFSGLPNEHIDPMTGNLILTFTDLVLPGNAGLDVRIQRVYNSKIYRNFDNQGDLLGEDSWAGVGWTMHLGRILDPEVAPVVELSDGSRHPTFRHIDGTGRFITKNYWVYDRNLSSPKLMLTNGVVYTFGAHINGMRHVTKIEDPFGNHIDITYGNAGAGEPADGIKTITQYLAPSTTRVVTFTYETSQPRKNLKTITYVGDKTYTWTYTHTTVPVQGPLHSLLTEVKPPVGPSWVYSYYESASPRYELKRMTAPGGGWTEYTYSTVTFYQPGSLTQVDTRAVIQKVSGGHDIVGGTWTFSFAEGSNKDRSTFNTPCGQVKYKFLGIGNQTSQVEAWEVGLMEWKETLSGSDVLEREDLTWQKGAAISVDPFFTGTRTDADTWVPLLQTRVVTRDGQTFTTDNTYHSTNFNDFGRPYHVTETGERSRTTELSFDYSFGSLYIKDKVSTETLTGDGKTLTKSFSYNNANGFKDAETIFGVTTTFSPDSFGNVDQVTDALNRGTGYSYDWGVVKNTITELYTIQRSINQSGTVASVTRDNKTTTFDYDTLFRIKTIDPPLGSNFVYTYDNSQGRWVELSRGTASQRTDLDGFGRPSATVNAVNVKRDFAYDSCGRMVYESYPFEGAANVGTAFQYDVLGRVTRRTHEGGTFVSYDYDGLDVTITNERGYDSTQKWEAWGDPSGGVLTRVDDQDSQSWSYDYDLAGNLIEVDPPGSAPNRNWVYNNKNQLQSESHPESGTVQYTYYANGNLQTRNDPAFGTTTYSHDDNNRVTLIDWPGTAFTDLDYDDSDNRVLLETESVRTAFGYDNANRLTSRSDLDKGGNFIFNAFFDYDARDNLEFITYPTETGQRLKVKYSYDNANRLTRIEEVGGTGSIYAQSFLYHPSGAPEQYVAGNGYTHEFEYHPDRYWVTNIRDLGGPEQVLDLEYLYDNAGNVEDILDDRPGMSQEYEYDPLDRLEQANGPWGTIDYEYDTQGNRTHVLGAFSTMFHYSGSTNRLTSATGDQPDSFGYDANGNLRTTATGVFTYSPRNMMISSDVGGGTAVYGYDGDNLRTYKASGGVTTHYFRGLGDLLLSEFETGCGADRNPGRDYIYAGTRLIAAVKYRLDPPAVLSPQDGGNDTTPTFEWGESSGAESYEVFVENVTDGTTELNVAGITDTTYTPSSPLPSGKTYRWKVRAESQESTSCFSDPETFDIDTVPPAPVTLVASVPAPGVIQLDWTAPGDDGTSGTAAAYDIRYQQGGAINFESATQAVGEPQPVLGGTVQSFQITGLPAETVFTVALKTVDDAGNLSASSNVVIQTTLDITPPGAVADLHALNPGFTTISLQWTAPHEDGAAGGAVSSYDVRYSTAPIDSGSFVSAIQVSGEPLPGIPGTVQTLLLEGLTGDTAYYFAIKSLDGAGNVSALSNVAIATTMDGVPPSGITDLGASPATVFTQLPLTAVSASGESAPTTVKEMAVDGDLSTLWSTPGRTTMQNEHITVDTGSLHDISRVRLRSRSDNGAYYPRDFQIQVSSNNVNFVTVHTKLNFTAASATWYEYDFTPTTGRYVRIYVTESVQHPEGTFFVQIAEVQAFEAGFLPFGVRLSWTAPGDSGAFGTAASYDVRYSATAIVSDVDFDAATPFSGEPSPQPAGSSEVFTPSGLPGESVVYFAVKTSDEVPNVSALSNVVNFTTPGVAPAAVTDLQATAGAAGSVVLTWSATGDDGLVGTASSYDVRYSTSPLSDGAVFDGATQAAGEPTPAGPGTPETMTVSGLSSDTVYYFAIKVGDELANISSISNVDTASTVDSVPPSGITDLGASPATVFTQLSLTAVSASGESAPTTVKEMAVDGDLSTLWSTPGRTTMQNEQITVDTGSLHDISRVRLRSRSDNGAYYPRDFQIQVSSNNVNFVTVYTKLNFTAASATWYEYDFTPTTGRYVRIFVTESVQHPGGTFFVQIAEIQAFEPSASNAVTLTWTATGDNGATGTATAYQIRYSSSAIVTETDFNNATLVSSPPAPSASGIAESFNVIGLGSGTFHFVLRALDETGNASPLSNDATVTLP